MPDRTVLRWQPVLPREQPRGELDVTWRWKLIVGRAKTCDVVVKHGSIPERQGHFIRLRNHWWVEDYSSPTGIYMRGKRIHLERVGDEAVDFSMICRFRFEKIPMPPEELALRAAIWAATDDDSRFLVYADWLQERGDELGQWMVNPSPPANAGVLGPLFSDGISLQWRHGFIQSLTLRSAKSVYNPPGAIEEALVHPLSAFLQRLEIDAVLLGAESDHAPAGRWLDYLFDTLETLQPRALRHLKVRLPAEERLGYQAAYSALKARLPSLQTGFEALFTEGALA